MDKHFVCATNSGRTQGRTLQKAGTNIALLGALGLSVLVHFLQH